MTKVSVLMTVYNRPQFLRECIDSVMGQTHEDWELIILEDNSPDPSVREIIEEYKDSRIKKFFSSVTEEERYETARYATLINVGVREYSTGEYLTYLTDDDFYYPHRLEVMSHFLDTKPRVDVVYGPQAQINAPQGSAKIRRTVGITGKAFCRIDHNSVMHRRRVFDEVGGWDDNKEYWSGADAYFWRKLNKHGYKFYPVTRNNDPLDAKRYHDSNVQRLITEKRFFPED